MENNKELINKKRLGRGIGSLLGGGIGGAEIVEEKSQTPSSDEYSKTTPATPVENPLDLKSRVWNISIDKLVPGIYQPRKNFEKEQLNELANSIKENGILQPLVVRKRSSGGYEIIAGERRWRASQIAGLHEVPALIKEVSDNEALQLAIIENVQREDLDPIEEAEAYQRLINEFSLSQQQVAEKVGKERSSVANALRLVSLPSELKEMISRREISAGHAKVILGISDKKEQIKIAKKVAEKQLSVRALEALVKNSEAQGKAEASSSPLNVDLSQKLANELSDQLQKSLGTKVEINYKKGKGSLVIHFYSDDQLNDIYEKMNK